MIKNRPEDPTSWILVPIPISKQRFRERGDNQAELIAQPLAQTFGLKTSSKILFKSKHTNKQGTAKSKQDRAQNILGSFQVIKKYQPFIQNKNIILIDDITRQDPPLSRHVKYYSTLEQNELLRGRLQTNLRKTLSELLHSLQYWL
jgi:hypothetical protein